MKPSKSAQEPVIPVLDLLRRKIREQSFTESEVAEALNWGRTCFEDLSSGTRRLYVDDLFSTLDAIGIEASAFFTELYGPPPRPSDPPAELASLSTTVDRIAELLIENGHFTAGELARATAAQRGRDPRQNTKAADGSPKVRDESATPTTASRGTETRA